MMTDWTGFTVVCMASGPSLTKEDAEIVRQWREAAPMRAVVVTNTTHLMAPWADVLYAMDANWWMKSKTGQRQFQGLKLTGAKRTTKNCPIATRIDFEQGNNSGVGAMLLAKHFGASKVILLGYDGKYAKGGQRHWHGDHPIGLGNCLSVGNFNAHAEQAAQKMGEAVVLNASRETKLTAFPRVTLEDALCDHYS